MTKNIKSHIEASKILIEIAGPSPDGYAYFSEQGIKLPKFVVTNRKNPIVINPFGEHPITAQVDAVVSARKMPYKDGSVDVLLASYLSNSSDMYMDIPVGFVRNILSHVLSKVAAYEYKTVNTKAKVNLRIRFLAEAYRCLKKGGLVVMVGPFEGDYPIAAALGYTVLVKDYYAKDESLTAIFQKQ